MEAIRKAIQDQDIDPRALKVLRDTTEKDGWVTERFCIYRYLDNNAMDEDNTSVAMQ